MEDPDRGRSERRVLVVDDSPTVRLAVRAMLEAAGWTVTLASTGEEAFRRCMQEPFEAVVTDLTMGALGGVQLCRLLRSTRETAQLSVVMLTASRDRRARFWARHAGADAYVEKDAVRVALAPALERVARPAPRELAASRPQPALERLSSVLDELLFRAVLGSEVHRLVERALDPKELSRELARLVAEVVDTPYLAVAIGTGALRFATLLTRGPWPRARPELTVARLGLEVCPEHVTVVEEPGAAEGGLELGEIASHPIAIGGEILGELRAAASRNRIAARDIDTLGLVARESALVAKTTLLQAQARAIARTDALTGVANRRALEERLAHEHERARRHRASLSVVICDVDRFKSVNDEHGHAIGDEVLRAIAAALRDSVRSIDLPGRWGGEEFLVILPDATEAGALTAAERMRAAIEALPAFAAGPASVTASFGVAAWPGGGPIETLIERADRALYRAKQKGRNRVELEPREPAP